MDPAKIASVTGSGLDRITVTLDRAASRRLSVGVWIGAPPPMGKEWDPALLAKIPIGSKSVEIDHPDPSQPVWAALLDAKGRRRSAPISGGAGPAPLPDAEDLSASSSAPAASNASSASGASGPSGPSGKPATAKSPCGCGGTPRIRVVVEIGGSDGPQVDVNQVDVNRVVVSDVGGRRGRPTPGGVPVRCLQNTGTSIGQTFGVALDMTPGEAGLTAQRVQINYYNANGHNVGQQEVTFTMNQSWKQVTSTHAGARKARSVDAAGIQTPEIDATSDCVQGP